MVHTNQYMRRQVVCDDSNSLCRVMAKCLVTNDCISGSWSTHDNLLVNHFAFFGLQNNAHFLQNIYILLTIIALYYM